LPLPLAVPLPLAATLKVASSPAQMVWSVGGESGKSHWA